MATRTKQAWKPWHGFAIEIGPDTDLGGDSFLVVEYQAGGYEPIAGVSTINEAQEIAADWLHRRHGMMPNDVLKVWARGVEGRFLVVPIVIDGVRR